MNNLLKDIPAIKQYYRKANLWIPKFSNFRFYKFRLKDNSFLQIKDTIRTTEDLRKWLVRCVPLDVYYSSGIFLEGNKVRGKRTNSHLLFRNLPFDIDSEKPHGKEQLETARIATINLIERVRDKFDLNPIYICFTAGKGFQVVYQFKNLNRKDIESLKINGLDIEVTLDKYRVIRLPLTINKSGRLAIFLTEKQLKSSMNRILKKSPIIYSPQNCGDRAGMPLKRQMTNFSSSQVNGEGSEVCSNRTSLTIFKEITNEVEHTKRFIPILKYNYREVTFNPKDEVSRIYKKYGLNEWFIFKDNQYIYYVSLVAFDKARLRKILNSSSSQTKLEFSKWGKIFMKIDDIDNPLMPVGVLYFDSDNKLFQYSRPHKDMVEHFNMSTNPLNNYIGGKAPSFKPKIYTVTKR